MKIFQLRFILLVLAVAAGFLRCGPAGENVRNMEAFYFPLDELKAGKVYEYQSVGHPNDPPFYWLYQTEMKAGRTFLKGMSYGLELSPDQYIREERVRNGMLLTDFEVYETGADGQKQPVKAQIEAANVFPFEVKKKPGALLSSVHWDVPGDTVTHLTLVRNRQFDKDTTYLFEGKKVPSIKFLTRELVDQEVEGHLELEYGGEEVYARGIGLVFFKKDIRDGYRMQYQLAAIHSRAAFEKMSGQVLKPW